jgi:hypothetical protein
MTESLVGRRVVVGAGVLLAAAFLQVAPLRGAETGPAGPRIAGVELPGRIEIEAHPLVLNGTALRKYALIKIYVAGLYLPRKESRPEAILAADEPRSLVMHFLKDVDADRLCEGWDSSLADNTPHPSPELQEQFRILCSWMEDAKDNDRLSFVYVPELGTSVRLHGRTKGPIAGKEFADALFRTWLGPKALPGEDFKQHLLGR